ncbi:MAG: histidine--tRNA ligase [Polyangiaceae bacterium]
MNDILPTEARRWRKLEAIFRRDAELYGFGEVRTPILEDTLLFEKEIGETSDVVEKEMYSFERHGDRLTVRPEGTAGAARAFVEHGVAAKEPVSRWYYLGPMFRGERPAKGRYRQFYQAGCEVFGDAGPICDAEVIELAVRILRDLGLRDLSVHINSLGSPEVRPRYRDALREFLSPRKSELSEDSQRRLDKNPLRILDSKDPADQAIAAQAPTIVDLLDDADREHFDGLRRALDALGIEHIVEPRLVRGLDYYTRTLFEIKATAADLGAQNTVCGGGRYDGMVKSLGGADCPAIGFAMGLERILLAAAFDGDADPPPIYVAALGPRAIAPMLKLTRAMRDRGLSVELDARDTKLKNMLRRADGRGARFFVLAGEDELAAGKIELKDLAARTQTSIALEGGFDSGAALEHAADRVRDLAREPAATTIEGSSR